ncbi:MAG: hypothetical protein DMG96_10590 [Acidobacteria bacterium]|nr:MAG: hypothetical protein DMG96_10590 [Acidobacteriota bacterium]
MTDYQKGVRFSKGAFRDVLGAGCCVIDTVKEQIVIMDLRPRPVLLERLPYQDALQNPSLIRVAGELLIQDAYLAATKLKDPVNDTFPTVREALLAVVTQRITDVTVEGRHKVLDSIIQSVTSSWRRSGSKSLIWKLPSCGRSMYRRASQQRQTNYGNFRTEHLFLRICLDPLGPEFNWAYDIFHLNALPQRSFVSERQARPRTRRRSAHGLDWPEKIFFLDIRQAPVSFQNRAVTLQDGVTVVYGFSATAEIRDVRKAIYATTNINHLLGFVLLAVSRFVLSAYSSDVLKLKKESVVAALTDVARSRLNAAGFELLTLRLTQLSIVAAAPQAVTPNR